MAPPWTMTPEGKQPGLGAQLDEIAKAWGALWRPSEAPAPDLSDWMVELEGLSAFPPLPPVTVGDLAGVIHFCSAKKAPGADGWRMGK